MGEGEPEGLAVKKKTRSAISPELVQAVQRGDAKARAELSTQLRGYLFAVASALGHTPDEAEDLASETLLRCLESLERFEGRAAIETWAYLILIRVRNQWLSRYRTANAGISLNTGDGDRRPPDPPDADPTGRPEQQALRAAAIGAAQDCFKRLTPAQHKACTARLLLALPGAEAAKRLGCTENAVNVNCHRGLRALRRCMEAKGYDLTVLEEWWAR